MLTQKACDHTRGKAEAVGASSALFYFEITYDSSLSSSPHLEHYSVLIDGWEAG